MTILKITNFTPELFGYLEHHSLLAHPVLGDLASETAKLPDAIMQIPRHQGGFMHLLTKMLGAKRAIEVGCYTGYSAIAVASALPADGRLTAFDVDPKTSAVAQKYFERAGLSSKIELVLGPALETLAKFVSDLKDPVDLAFIDADKVNYEIYYELCVKALRPGGVILVDNAFRDGEILAPAVKDLGTQAVDRLTKFIERDSRVEASMLPIADGIILVRKK